MKQLKASSIIVAVAFLVLLLSPAAVFAHHTTGHTLCQQLDSAGVPNVSCGPDDTVTILGAVVLPIVQLLLVLIGIAAVIMLIVGGFRYVVSAGDPEAIKGAKNTILYAIIGVVVAFSSFAIMSFLMDRL